MSEELKNHFKIPENHSIKLKESQREQRKGQDTDIYIYEEFDQVGNFIATYRERDSTSIYPPFERSVSFEKIN